MRWFRGTLDNAHLPRVFLNAVLALLLFAGSCMSMCGARHRAGPS